MLIQKMIYAKLGRLKDVLKICGDMQSNCSPISTITLDVAEAVSPITFTEG